MKRVYADYNATTPCSESHFHQVCKALKDVYGNPSSVHHFGREAKNLLEDSRSSLASFLGVSPKEIFFTSGATEANNLVLQGVCDYQRYKQKKTRMNMLLSPIEHSSILKVAQLLEDRGLVETRYVKVDKHGFIDVEHLVSQIDEHTILATMIYVNNEIGVINPVQKLAQAIKSKNPKVHVHIDAVQAFGKVDMSWVQQSGVDSAAMSAHKLGAFKGIGCLYKRQGTHILPSIWGGGQEKGLRSGTENMPGILSFGIKMQELISKPSWVESLTPIRDTFVAQLKSIKGVHIHGDPQTCLPTTVNFHVEGLSGDLLMLTFDTAGIAVSSGSACASGGGAPSPVLKALGYSDHDASNSIRVSFGYDSKLEDVEQIVKVLSELRARYP